MVGYLNPVSENFNHAANAFHDLKKWQQAAAIIAGIAGAILTPFILCFGSFAAFRWTVELFTKQNNHESNKDDLQTSQQLSEESEAKEIDLEENTGSDTDPHELSLRIDELSTHLKGEEVLPVATAGKDRVKQLVAKFDALWDEEGKQFEELPFDLAEASSLLEEHNRAFHSFTTDQKENFGIIYKQDLQKDSKIFVRADLHGDLKSLLENLKELQKQGLLDENYHCKANVQLVFLGDYMDRGSHAIEIAQILASLRLENPRQIHLLRGNHEDLGLNFFYGAADKHLKDFLSDDEKKTVLSNFYDTMPLSVYLGEEGADQREYIQFSHALFEMQMDPSLILDEEEGFSQVVVPRKLSLSERVQSIGSDDDSKVSLAAKKVKELAEKEDQGNRSDAFGGILTAYQWADVGDDTYISSLGNRKWRLSPEDIKHSFRLASTKHKVKMLFRGHQHYFKHHCVKVDKVIVSTLPVGMDSPYKACFPDQADRAYILDVRPKVKDWTKKAITRKSGESVSEISEPVGIRETRV
ncbi:hypothetical protein WCH_BJ09020 [Waddlia chondrophila 2032/99]|uniref:Serine/threonine specific protein phosphatases domain-containing protein n=1 Tax=Waddlia chondrophila 2032/99 TaxID=765953 RepID=F8LEU9_9BACT|nr:hypothetical protein WCH_BJ09020 [Waddlia chondrophila 2032/99]